MMNKKFFKDKITVYHFENDTTTIKTTFEHVYFRHNKKTNVVDKGIETASTGSITIPTKDYLEIQDNDIVIEGIIKEDYNLRELQKKYQIFRINSVDDNRKGTLQHYKLGVIE